MGKARIQWWVPTGGIIVAAYATVSMLVQPGYFTSIFGNLVQAALLILLLLLTLLNSFRTQGRIRYFWALLSLGSALWLTATVLWTWYGVVQQEQVPFAITGDLLFFVHIVPMIGALAVRPHLRGTRSIEFGNLDFTLLLLWWIYLYCFVVIPWQYVSPDCSRYALNFNLIYLFENAVLLMGLAWLTFGVRGPWRRVYAPFLVGESVYTVASQIVNRAIERDKYYTGSIYDIPIVIALTLFIFFAVVAVKNKPQPEEDAGPQPHAVLLSRLSMCAVLSLPFIGAWGILFSEAPHRIVVYRILLTLLASVVMPFIVFLKQHLLDCELVRLLGASRHNYENLKRLQAQLVQSEKLAALSQFVAGAAHQINNPLTAVIGYSDLMEQESPADDERGQWAKKIGQQARRTQEMVKNLLTFARQSPSTKAVLDINSLVANAIELRELDLNDDRIRIVPHLDSRLPNVWGDGNQLLQVCFHIIGNAIDAMKGNGGGVLHVWSRLEDNQVALEFSDNGPGIADPKKIFDPFYTTKPVGQGAGLGLSACYGIVSEHGGKITFENKPGGGAAFKVLLPTGLPEKCSGASSTERTQVAIAKQA